MVNLFKSDDRGSPLAANLGGRTVVHRLGDIRMSEDTIWASVSTYDPQSTVAKALAKALSLHLLPLVQERGLDMTFEDYATAFKSVLALAPQNLVIPGIDSKFVAKHFSYEALVDSYKKAKSDGDDGYHIMSLIGMVRNEIMTQLEGTLAWKFQYLSDGFASIHKDVATTFTKLEGKMGAVYSGSANKIVNAFCSNTGTMKRLEFFGTTYGSKLAQKIQVAVKKLLLEMWDDARSVN
jgi:hypothetical protein